MDATHEIMKAADNAEETSHSVPRVNYNIPGSTSTKPQRHTQAMLISLLRVLLTATRMIAMVIIKMVAENMLSRITFFRRGIRVFPNKSTGIERTLSCQTTNQVGFILHRETFSSYL